jgi:hypothetical protein
MYSQPAAMNYQLGNLEETVLLIALYLDEVYGVSVAEEYKKQTGHGISVPANKYRETFFERFCHAYHYFQSHCITLSVLPREQMA